MGFITHFRGHLHPYYEHFDESMLVEEVTLNDYLAIQYPRFLVERFPKQARIARRRAKPGTLGACRRCG